MMSKQTKGVVLILIASFFWGIAGTVAKMMFNTAMDPIQLVTMRMSLASVIVFVYLGITDEKLLRVTKMEVTQIAILGIFGIIGMQACYYYTISILNVSLAIFLQMTSPILITLFCIFVYKEKMSIYKILALGIAMTGSYFIIFGGGDLGVELKPIGILTGIASAFFSAFYALYGEKCTGKFSPWTILAYGMGAGALMLSLFYPPWQLWAGRTSSELLFVGYIAIFGTIIPFALYLHGINIIGPSKSSIINLSESVIASVSAYLILGEYMAPKQLLGASFIMGGVVILQVGEKIAKKVFSLMGKSQINK